MTELERWMRACREAVEGALSGEPPALADLEAPSALAGELQGSLALLMEKLGAEARARREQWGLAERIYRGAEPELVLEEAYPALRELLSFNRLAFAQLTEDGSLETRWVRSEDGVASAGVGYRAPLRASSSLPQLIERGEARVIADLDRYLEENPWSSATRKMRAWGIRSSLTVPLGAQERPLGFLFFSSDQAGAFANDHVEQAAPLLRLVDGSLSRNRRLDELNELRKTLLSANALLTNQAMIDPLTGIANRRQFDEVFDREHRRALRTKAPLSLLMVDVDHFKPFNDTYGHDHGDEALRRVARALEGELRRGGDLAARYGGEEFAVVLPDTTEAAAFQIGQRLRAGIERLAIPHKASPVGRISISIGASTLAHAGEDDEARVLLAAADCALYDAKAEGRDQVRMASVKRGLSRSPTGAHLLR